MIVSIIEKNVYLSECLINLTNKKMKKLFFIMLAGFFLFSSCRKTRECVCTYSDGSSYTETYLLAKKKEAQAMCEDKQYVGVSCELK